MLSFCKSREEEAAFLPRLQAGSPAAISMDSTEADDEDEETFLEVVSRPYPSRGEQA
jgi:hypothetical protein